jgi:pantothenate kinase
MKLVYAFEMPETLKSLEELLAKVNSLLDSSSGRVIIGIVGKPGAGKSTITDYIMKNIKIQAALVPMDGYHLSNKVLIELGRRERKGAPDTFDAKGFTSLLERIRNNVDEDIYFPVFHREFEESYSAEGVVEAGTRLVLTEGNYLLVDDEKWGGIRPLLNESWYLAPDDAVRQERLIARHMKYGKSKEEAEFWSLGSDEANAQVVAASSKYATRIVEIS